MTILLLAEHDNQQLKPVTRSLLRAAEQLNDDIHVLIIGANCQALAEAAALLPLQKKILVADDATYAHPLAENVAPLLAELASGYTHILTAATTMGKNILPRVAALLDVSMVSDVLQINTTDTFVRPIYAGNILATVKSTEKIKLLTIRTTAFNAVAGAANTPSSIVAITQLYANNLSKFVSEELTHSTRPELTAARVIISGGRGLKSAENFKLIEIIADQLNAAIGASRAAVDAGFATNDLQVGQTGKVVAPDLYIAVGISGAIQHIAGMKDSKVIVVINNDPEAPILQIADYALIGDLFTLLPELAKALAKA